MAARKKRLGDINAIIGASPMIVVAVGVYIIGIIYSIALSFTDSKLLPQFDEFVGLENYERLWSTSRWLVSVENIWLYGFMTILANLVIGFILAACMDRDVRLEDTFRTIILYPFAMSLIVTGLIWQWMLDPNLGIQETLHQLGFENASFAPLVDAQTAIYGVVVAAVWQGSGVTMAILLAGMRGIDQDIWKAARVDGVPVWATYIFVVLPMLTGALATAFVLQCVGVVRVYDLIVAITNGGPGIATEMPAKFVIDHITQRVNVAIGMAAAAMMLLPIIVLIAIRALVMRRLNRAEAAAS